MGQDNQTKKKETTVTGTFADEGPSRGRMAPAKPLSAVGELPPQSGPAVSDEDLLKSEISELKVRKAKGSKNIIAGICNILATFNNTKINFADPAGNTISWSNAGKCGFKGSRKSTAYAAQIVTQDAGKTAMSHGLKSVYVKVSGPGLGREAAIRALQALGFDVTGILECTPMPHNGCRKKKRRRV